jgi:D-glycero-D-manno-heptose 1,7-bisphosphate phosphatase
VKAAAFLDRDGTLLDDPGYLGDPAKVRLLPGVIDALRRLEQMGIARVVVTNQSGIGRGLLQAEQVREVHREVDRQLAQAGASVDAWYFCPHAPDAQCDCRKPGIGMHQEAARDLGIDLTSSWCVGDRMSDVLAADGIGARAVLVLTGDGPRHADEARAAAIPVVADLGAAVSWIARALGH